MGATKGKPYFSALLGSRKINNDCTIWWLKYGFYMWYFFSEWTSDQLNISWPFLSSLLAGCNSKATANPPKSDDRNGQASRNLQLIRGTFWKEIQLLKSILRKIANRLNENTPNIDPRNKKNLFIHLFHPECEGPLFFVKCAPEKLNFPQLLSCQAM